MHMSSRPKAAACRFASRPRSEIQSCDDSLPEGEPPPPIAISLASESDPAPGAYTRSLFSST